jgi:hypothetical protein
LAEGERFVRRATAFARFARNVDLDANIERRQRGGALGGEAFGNFQTFDGVHPIEVFGDQAGLVALQRADEMPA